MARVRIYHNRAQEFAKSRVRPRVDGVANKILNGARALAPRGTHLHGSGRPVAGRALYQSLDVHNVASATQVRRLVGAQVAWAATVHQGSKPHAINAKTKLLTFRWERGTLLVRGRGRRRGASMMFRFHRVNHPGNKRPVRYLTTPMHLYGRAAGFRTVTRLSPTRSRLP